MKKVLIIGPDFAPSSLPPALRVRFFANHLAGFGWKPTVLAVDPEYYEAQGDPENESLVDASVEVVRTAAFSHRWTRRLGVGDLGLRSLLQLRRAAARLCAAGGVDLVFIPVPPYYPMVLGRYLRKRFGVPYIVDYIDPWRIEDYWKLPKRQRPPKWGLAYRAARWLEPWALRRVSHVVGVSRGTVDGVAAHYPWLGPRYASEIPYGGEPKDFEYLRRRPRPGMVFDKGDGLFHLTYAGAFIAGMHATARAIFKAVRSGLESRPELFERLRVHLVGTSYSASGHAPKEALRLAREAGIGDRVFEHPRRIPYLDALQLLLDSDGLVAIGSDAPHYTASKLFPYLLARKPILAVFHEKSSVVRILEETGAGTAVTYGDEGPPEVRIPEIRSALERIMDPAFKVPAVSMERFEPFEARTMAARLADVFDAVAERGRGAAGRVGAGPESP